MRTGLAGWYFSKRGGMFLTVRAREFHFALQDMLATLSVLDGWHCNEKPSKPRERFEDVLKAAKNVDAPRIIAGLEESEKLDATEWRKSIQSATEYLATLITANHDRAGPLVFATVQQVSSALRSQLAQDVRSRLDVDLPR